MVAEQLTKRSKEKLYRGKNVEELKAMDTREFAKLVKARPRRTILRNYDVIEQFIRKCEKRSRKKSPIRTHNRSLVIVPKMIERTVLVHNGKEFVRVIITEEMLGHRLGEFAQTRKIAKHTTVGKRQVKK